MTESPYGPPPATAPRDPRAVTSPPPPPYPQAPQAQAQYGHPQYGQAQPGPVQYGRPQYGQPQFGAPVPAAAYGLPKAKRPGKGMMIAGPLIFLAGVLITVITYAIAPPGGAYLISFGPMVWGVIWFIRGLVAYNRSK